MKDLNAVHLIGRLGQDPEVQNSDRGTARTTFSVATTRSWTAADGQVQTETEWSRCVSWGTLAEVAAQYLHKGSRVYVQGRLHTSTGFSKATWRACGSGGLCTFRARRSSACCAKDARRAKCRKGWWKRAEWRTAGEKDCSNVHHSGRRG
jgi:single-strand DNA-binding protein